jgi:hypothetical protein
MALVRDDRQGERKATPLIEWIRKIDVPGKAKCIVCDKIISYGAQGRIVLLNTCCFLYKSLIRYYTFDPICIMRGTFMKYMVKVFIFTVQAEQS